MQEGAGDSPGWAGEGFSFNPTFLQIFLHRCVDTSYFLPHAKDGRRAVEGSNPSRNEYSFRLVHGVHFHGPVAEMD